MEFVNIFKNNLIQLYINIKRNRLLFRNWKRKFRNWKKIYIIIKIKYINISNRLLI
jgi:hypothetical protein